MTTPKEASRIALAALDAAIAERHGEGCRVPCEGDARFISESAAERAAVAPICRHACTVVELCREAGRRERHGIWGGVDRTPRTRETTTKTDKEKAR